MKRKLVYLVGVLIFSFAMVMGVSAQEKGTQEKKEVKKELSDKKLQKKLGMTKAEFDKLPEKCKSCPSLLKCKGKVESKTAKNKDNGSKEAATMVEELEGNAKSKAREKKVVKKK